MQCKTEKGLELHLLWLTKTGPSSDEVLHKGHMIDLDPGHPFNIYRGRSHGESDLCVIAVFAEGSASASQFRSTCSSAWISLFLPGL